MYLFCHVIGSKGENPSTIGLIMNEWMNNNQIDSRIEKKCDEKSNLTDKQVYFHSL